MNNTQNSADDYLAVLTLINSRDISETWPLVEQMISDALIRSNEHTANDILKDLISGDAQMWLAWHENDGVLGVMVTYMQQTTLSCHLRIFLCVGEQRKRWLHHIESVEQWAKNKGANKVSAVVRPGWEKVLPNYRKTHVTLEKNL